MKRFIFLALLSFTVLISAKGQNVVRDVFSSGNGSAVAPTGESVNYTIGQSYFTHTITYNNAVYLTQGFEQPVYEAGPLLAGFSGNNLNIMKLNVYPNPAVDYAELEVDLINDNGAKVTLIDVWGKVLKAQDFNVVSGSQKLNFQFGSLPSGVYTINVKANNRSYSKKLIVTGTSTAAAY